MVFMNKITLSLALGALLLPSMAMAENEYLDRTGWTWEASSSYPTGTDGGGVAALHDGDRDTYWHSDYGSQASKYCPHWILIDRGSDSKAMCGLSYWARAPYGSNNTYVTAYRIYLSDNVNDFSYRTWAVTEDVLGIPDYKGSWDETYEEKICNFDAERTERYILFIIDSSVSGRSAAIAELNMLSKPGEGGNGGGGGGGTTSGLNSVKIVLPDASEHRIALDGDNLKVSLNEGAIRLANSGIIVEYDMAEVRHFAFEHYDFPEDAFYVGTKEDLTPAPIIPDPKPTALAIMPDDGIVESITGFSLVIPAASMPVPATDFEEKITLTFDNMTLWSATTTDMVKFAPNDGGNEYVVTGLEYTDPGTYTLTVPEGFFVDTEANLYSTAATAEWVIEEIEDPNAGISSVSGTTLMMRHEGGVLYISGISTGHQALLLNASGSVMAASAVDARGCARIRTSSLAAGAYILNVDGKTFKIIL